MELLVTLSIGTRSVLLLVVVVVVVVMTRVEFIMANDGDTSLVLTVANNPDGFAMYQIQFRVTEVFI